MKIVEITTYYPAYIDKFYKANRLLAGESYKKQLGRLYYDSFGWSDFWVRAMAPLGYETDKIILNVHPLQKAWADENKFGNLASLNDWDAIGLQQIKILKPDVIFYDHHDTAFLKAIKKEVPSVRLILGWAGSAIPNSDVWNELDVILSCAPETVEYFKAGGHENVFHLNHAFDPVINERLIAGEKKYRLSFIGQLLRHAGFHIKREAILEELVKNFKSDVSIFSPDFDSVSFFDNVKFIFRNFSYKIMKALKNIGISEKTLSVIPKVGKAALWKDAPQAPINPALKKYIRPGVFGLQMYQIIRDSSITLNIHADSSPRFASNMRLFEVTGVGGCLVSDWRPNISELFEPDYEIVTYKSVDECAEKVKWLLNNPGELGKISAAGTIRCKKDHSFSERAKTLDAYIKKCINR